MTATFSDDTVVRASSNQVSSSLGDEAVVLNFENGVYYGLNPVSARIMELLSEPRSVGDILDTLLEEYEVERERCRADLVALLEKLEAHNLIETQQA
ncbi:MAG: PqqD family peptide modification chaperone [Bacteroidota bacterium]